MDNNCSLKEYRVHGRLKRNVACVTFTCNISHKREKKEWLSLHHILSKIII